MKKRLLLAPLIVLVILVAACGGRTINSTNVGSTTATLNYEGHCDQGDSGEWYVQYRTNNGTPGAWVDGTHHPLPVGCATGRVPASGEAPLSDNVTGLTPDTPYEWRATVKFSNGQTAWTDIDGNPNGTNYDTFRTDPAATGDNSGVWLTDAQIAALPTSGSAYTAALSAANGSWTTPNLSDQDDKNDTSMLAAAIVAKRNNNSTLTTKVRDACLNARETENGGRVLALGRQLQSVAIACDITLTGSDRTTWKSWLSTVRTESMTECTNLISCSNTRPNNWGTHATAARLIADKILGDTTDFNAAANVYKGWLGDRATYASFSYGDLAWQDNQSAPVGINRPNTTISGHNVDGLLPEEMRRSGAFTYPYPEQNYAYEALQGAIVSAVVLERAGVSVKTASTSALNRAYAAFGRSDWTSGAFEPTGDDTWQPWLQKCLYGSATFTPGATSPGKNMGWTDWTHPNTGNCS